MARTYKPIKNLSMRDSSAPNAGDSMTAVSEVSSETLRKQSLRLKPNRMLKTRQQPLPKSLPLKSRLRPAPSIDFTAAAASVDGQ